MIIPTKKETARFLLDDCWNKNGAGVFTTNSIKRKRHETIVPSRPIGRLVAF
jgi:hypothetical protein